MLCYAPSSFVTGAAPEKQAVAVCSALFDPIDDQSAREDSRVRKDLIAVLGLPRFLSVTKTRVIDEDRDRSNMPRRLLQLEVGWRERWCVVEVCCPSTRDLHYLWVPPDMERCSQAVAWTFGFETDQYLPSMEA